jgi:hypothetical protein
MTLGAPPRFGAWRRTAGVAAAVGGALVATSMVSTGTSGAQAAGFNNGTGSAIAQSARIDPVAGGLSFGIGVGESLAGHQNTVATSESRAASLGVIGVTLGAPGCDGGDPTLPKEQQPQPVRTQSGAEGADAGITSQDPVVPGINRTVRATTAPFAETITRSEGLDIPGVIEVGPTVSVATSGVFDGYREATATTDITAITLGGLVTLENLHWEAYHRTGGDPSEDVIGGTFTIGGITALNALGIPLPIATNDVLGALAQVNQVLELTGVGLRIESPTYHLDTTSTSTLATVDPLAIALVPGALRDSIVQPVLSGLQPVRDPLFQGLIDADCSLATPITILDILLNATGPGGQLSLDLGGVQASSSAITLFSGLGDLPPLPPLSPASAATPGSPGTPARPGTPGGTSSAPTAAGSTATAAPAATSGETPLQEVADILPGERGGKMLAVGLGGLLALFATAEGDRRKMRRAQREIPLEA